ncbi:single-stranded DNA-binding protein [Helicobacter sp. 23-1044]
MFNKIIIVGNLTRDVELKYLQSGSAVATIGLASNRKYKKQDGDWAEETCFVDVSLFGRTAEVANQYLKKGSQVLIEGRLKLDTWNDANGQKRSKHTITAESMQMLGKKDGGDSASYSGQSYSTPSASSAPSSAPKAQEKVPEIDIDDEIPF